MHRRFHGADHCMDVVQACKESTARWTCFLYDFVIDQEATPSGGYSIPSYCMCLCGGIGADQLGFFWEEFAQCLCLNICVCVCVCLKLIPKSLNYPRIEVCLKVISKSRYASNSSHQNRYITTREDSLQPGRNYYNQGRLITTREDLLQPGRTYYNHGGSCNKSSLTPPVVICPPWL